MREGLMAEIELWLAEQVSGPRPGLAVRYVQALMAEVRNLGAELVLERSTVESVTAELRGWLVSWAPIVVSGPVPGGGEAGGSEVRALVYDVGQDKYVDPVTGVEPVEQRQRRLVEESSPSAVWGRG